VLSAAWRADERCATTRPVGREEGRRRMTTTAEVSHPLFARLYARQSHKAEAKGIADQRRRTLSGLSGSVVEVGAGNGLNFGHYPAGVSEVIAVEPEPYLRAEAERAANEASVEVSVVAGVAEDLPLANEAVDAGVASMVLCSVADPELALRELYRVIRPGGELRFNEHVISERRGLAVLQRGLDVVWPHVAGGCHLGRDTGALLREAGFEVERVERFTFGLPPLDPPKPHILGIALKPAR
jgi:SAM-dependent methyltransferase